ncbi:MAG: 4Fe-4S binding protein [Dehalococcoidia bacterium]|nr:4Fe-4S binding protein [Dehalococcoidia bacterium]
MVKLKSDKEECILCRMCVRACQDKVGVGAITFLNAEGEQKASVVWDKEKCIACGACAYICPTQAVTLSDEPDKRVINIPGGKLEFTLKTCAKCGSAYAPEKQLAYMAKQGRLPIERFAQCPDCRTEQSTTYVILDTCKCCGACVAACPQNAITLEAGSQPAVLDLAKCVRCGRCYEACSFNAITVK